MTQTPVDLSIILPALNESSSLAVLLPELTAAFPGALGASLPFTEPYYAQKDEIKCKESRAGPHIDLRGPAIGARACMVGHGGPEHRAPRLVAT